MKEAVLLHTDLIEALLMGVFSAVVAITVLVSLGIAIVALRAKLRARAHLYRAGLRDMALQKVLVSLDQAENLPPEEIARLVTQIEAQLTVLSERDRSYISQGLHQSSPRGVRRFAKELATAH